MAITSIPTQVTPPLWAYTFVQAPINGNGYDYFNTAVKRTNYGSISAGSLAIDVTSAAIHRWQPTANLSANVTLLNFFTPNQGTTIYGGVAFADINAA